MPTHEHLPTHPRTGLHALGVLPSGRVVWPQMGGDGTGDGGDGQGGNADPGDGGDGDQNNDGGNQGQQGGQEPPTGPDGQPLDPARLQRLVENLRSEITTLKGKQGGQQQGTGQAPEPQQDPAGQEPATDDGTAAELTATKTELAIFKAAGKHGADPSKLTDSRSFMDKVADLPTEDRAKKLGELIKKTLEEHPHYGTGQAPGTSPRGGSDGTGRPGAPARPKGLDGAVSAHYTKK